MTDPELFKYDVRVRERMLKRGSINESELEKHLAALPDGEAQCDTVELSQPALGTRGTLALNDRPSHPHADEDLEAS